MIKKKEQFWNILLFAAIIAAVISFFTTAFGLTYYLSFIFAIPIALAVQMGLFGLAWLIGFGNNRIKPLIISLYILTMLFSVTFSYVFLQSELVENVKPQATRRALVDDLRGRMLTFGNTINQGINEAEAISTRLDMWLGMEAKQGWATKTCEGVDQCYLQNVCNAVKGKISQWEKQTGQSYRHGPGRQLIYGALEEECRSIEVLIERLRNFRTIWSKNSVLAEKLSNRDRLIAFDNLLSTLPKKDLEAVLCREIDLAVSPNYNDFARDNVTREEKQVYAVDDLSKVFSDDHKLTRSDYPTIFALCLALFIDLFVLIVAIGAALVDEKKEAINLDVKDTVPCRDETEIRKELSRRLSGALLGKNHSPEEQVEFARELIKNIRVKAQGKDVLIPTNKEQYRFGTILKKAKAAEIKTTKLRKEKSVVFVLEDWVYQALIDYVNGGGEGHRA